MWITYKYVGKVYINDGKSYLYYCHKLFVSYSWMAYNGIYVFSKFGVILLINMFYTLYLIDYYSYLRLIYIL